jgi:hypothetical protein
MPPTPSDSARAFHRSRGTFCSRVGRLDNAIAANHVAALPRPLGFALYHIVLGSALEEI